MALKDLISLHDLTPREVGRMFEQTADLKKDPRAYSESLAGSSVVLIFEKPSLRTRVTFDLVPT